MNTRTVRLAMVQMLVEGGAKQANVARAVARITEAARRGAQIVVLPEALDLGWTHPAALTEAEPVPGGGPCEALRQAARAAGVFVCAGLTERASDQAFNAAVLFSPAGELLLHHRKLNELEIGHACYAQGDRLAVAHTELGVIGVMICADAFARGQVVTRTLGLMGAELIVSPCAWAVPADHDNRSEPYGQLWRDSYGPVARDFQLWIAGVSNVGPITGGPWAGRKCVGCSLLVGPTGEPEVQGPYGETADAILLTELELRPRPARGDGWERIWAAAQPTGSV